MLIKDFTPYDRIVELVKKLEKLLGPCPTDVVVNLEEGKLGYIHKSGPYGGMRVCITLEENPEEKDWRQVLEMSLSQKVFVAIYMERLVEEAIKVVGRYTVKGERAANSLQSLVDDLEKSEQNAD